MSVLEKLVRATVDLAKIAQKHRKSLRGDNFYGNKLAEVRADATNAFRQLSSRSAGDSSALAELVEAVFSADTDQPKRLQASRELVFALRTTWQGRDLPEAGATADDVFP